MSWIFKEMTFNLIFKILSQHILIMSKNYEIDNIDLKILNILSEDAKMPYTDTSFSQAIFQMFENLDTYLERN